MPAAAHPRLAAGPEDLRRAHPPLGGGGDHVELGIADAADAEVVADVDRALLGQPGGALEQPQGGVAVGTDELLGHRGHLLARLQVALGGAPVDVPRVERDQPAGRVQHVGGRRVQGVDVPDGVAQHDRQPGLLGEPQHRLRPGPVAPAAVVHDLEHQPTRPERRPPGVEVGDGVVGPPGEQRPADRGVGAEQRDQPRGVLGGHRQRAHRLPPRPAQVGGAGEPAQRPPASAVPGEEGDPRQPWVDAGAAARRGPGGTAPAGGVARARRADEGESGGAARCPGRGRSPDRLRRSGAPPPSGRRGRTSPRRRARRGRSGPVPSCRARRPA